MVGRRTNTDRQAEQLSSAVQKVESKEQRQEARTGKNGQRIESAGRSVHDAIRENA